MANITIPTGLAVGQTFTANSKTFQVLQVINAGSSQYVYEETSVVASSLTQAQVEAAGDTNFGLVSGERLSQAHAANSRVLFGAGAPANPPATINANLPNTGGYMYVDTATGGSVYAWNATDTAWSAINIGTLTQAQADNNTDTTAGAITGQVLQAALATHTATLGNYEGTHDASGGANPTTTGLSGTIVAGDYLRVDVAGTLPGADNGPTLNAGDVLIAKQDNPTAAAHWSRIDSSAAITYSALTQAQADNPADTTEGLITGTILQAALDARIDANFNNASANALQNQTLTTALAGVGLNQVNTGAAFPATPAKGTQWQLDGHATLADGLYQADNNAGWQAITAL